MWYDDRDTWIAFKPTEKNGDRVVKFLGGHRIKRWDIPSYFDEDFLACAELVNNFHHYGLPYSMGWAEHPAHVIEVLKMFERVKQKEMRSRSGDRSTRVSSQGNFGGLKSPKRPQ
jgi:hypothetical protein